MKVLPKKDMKAYANGYVEVRLKKSVESDIQDELALMLIDSGAVEKVEEKVIEAEKPKAKPKKKPVQKDKAVKKENTETK